MTEPTHLLDYDTLNDLRAMLDDGLDELLSAYLNDSEVMLNDLLAAAEQGDHEAVVSLAHSLKGSSGNLGVLAVYRESEAIEHEARGGTLSEPVARVQKLQQLHEQTREKIAAMLQ